LTLDLAYSVHYTSCMVAARQTNIRLSEEDTALLRRVAEFEQRTASDTIRVLIRRAAKALKRSRLVYEVKV
jgi:uncharacterized protein (DUF1778 family)